MGHHDKPELRKYDHLWVALFNQDGEIDEPWYQRVRPEPKRLGMHRWRKRNGAVENVVAVTFPEKTGNEYIRVEKICVLDDPKKGQGDVLYEKRLNAAYLLEAGSIVELPRRYLAMRPEKIPGVIKWRV